MHCKRNLSLVWKPSLCIHAGFSPEIFLHLVRKMNKCQLAKNWYMVLINLHLVLAILFGLQCVLKVWIYTWWYGSGTSLHMVVVPFINVTLGARTKCVLYTGENPAYMYIYMYMYSICNYMLKTTFNDQKHSSLWVNIYRVSQ